MKKDWQTREPEELQRLAEQLKRTVPFSLTRLMNAAGLTTESLRNWCNGSRLPQPESMERVARVLMNHGQRMQAQGRELLVVVEEEEARRLQARNAGVEEVELPLFTGEPAADR